MSRFLFGTKAFNQAISDARWAAKRSRNSEGGFSRAEKARLRRREREQNNTRRIELAESWERLAESESLMSAQENGFYGDDNE